MKTKLTQVKTLTGHLTSLDKRAMLEILNAGETSGKSGRKTWKIEGNTVWTTESVTDWNGKRPVTFKATFKAS